MKTNFLKTALGLASVVCLSELLLNFVFEIVKFQGPLATVAAIATPIMVIVAYAMRYHKDMMAPLFNLKVGLYSFLFYCVQFIATGALVKKFMWPTIFKNIDPTIAAAYQTISMPNLLVAICLFGLVLLPLTVAFRYIQLTIANMIGAGFAKAE